MVVRPNPKYLVAAIPEVYLPAPLLAKIVSYVAESGVDSLKSFVKAGPLFKAAVYSKETLSCVRLDRSWYFMWWSMPHSIYYHFFTKCLDANNPHALTAVLYKGIAYENLVAECYRSSLWMEPYGEDGGWVQIDGAYWAQPRVRESIPRCSRCKSRAHKRSNCPKY
ncbi:unnamed protein product [Arabidopsis thaliana]|uniref:Similarity to replication protein A1 n=1 Tax=Arabidopsis thaliana TaxID=3702 RepID=Q9FGB2_ARATH|nr:unnamed protein product [Arabidopsis thaliana]